MAIEIVDFPSKNGDFPVRYVKLPEGSDWDCVRPAGCAWRTMTWSMTWDTGNMPSTLSCRFGVSRCGSFCRSIMAFRWKCPGSQRGDFLTQTFDFWDGGASKPWDILRYRHPFHMLNQETNYSYLSISINIYQCLYIHIYLIYNTIQASPPSSARKASFRSCSLGRSCPSRRPPHLCWPCSSRTWRSARGDRVAAARTKEKHGGRFLGVPPEIFKWLIYSWLY